MKVTMLTRAAGPPDSLNAEPGDTVDVSTELGKQLVAEKYAVPAVEANDGPDSANTADDGDAASKPRRGKAAA